MVRAWVEGGGVPKNFYFFGFLASWVSFARASLAFVMSSATTQGSARVEMSPRASI